MRFSAKWVCLKMPIKNASLIKHRLLKKLFLEKWLTVRRASPSSFWAHLSKWNCRDSSHACGEERKSNIIERRMVNSVTQDQYWSTPASKSEGTWWEISYLSTHTRDATKAGTAKAARQIIIRLWPRGRKVCPESPRLADQSLVGEKNIPRHVSSWSAVISHF